MEVFPQSSTSDDLFREIFRAVIWNSRPYCNPDPNPTHYTNPTDPNSNP